jgi:triosephosphate isomerase
MLCVGEKLEERKSNRTERILKRQLESGLAEVRPDEVRRVTIAYEPVWAIGTGEVATPEQVGTAHAIIRKWIGQKLGQEAAEAMRILYGGSVSPDNVRGLLAVEDVDGVLVGGASLKGDTFIPIIEYDH